MMTTIKDIAQIAKVSRGTVDKVIHNRPGVKPETRARVQNIIAELNYKPNPIGMALANSRSVTRIGVILTPINNQFMKITLNGILYAEKELKPYGVEIITRTLSSVDPKEELEFLKEFHEAGIRYIAFVPLEDNDIITYANRLVKHGTVLIEFNCHIPKINTLWFVGQDHVKGGRTAAQLMTKLFPRGGKLGIIVGSGYMNCHQERLAGFREKISESPVSYQIVDIKPNNDMTEITFQIVTEWLQQYPDLDAIYITSGGISGVASALACSGKTRQVKLICHDLIPDSERLLKEGIIDFVIDQNPFKQGELIVNTLFDYRSSHKIPTTNDSAIPIYIRVSESL